MRSQDGTFYVESVPKMTDVATMSQRKLEHLLRYCPMSVHFGRPLHIFNGAKKEKLREIALKMVASWNQLIQDKMEGAISERSDEQSERASGAIQNHPPLVDVVEELAPNAELANNGGGDQMQVAEQENHLGQTANDDDEEEKVVPAQRPLMPGIVQTQQEIKCIDVPRPSHAESQDESVPEQRNAEDVHEHVADALEGGTVLGLERCD